MLKILTSQQSKALDAYTIQHTPVASIDLMERACQAFVQWFLEQYHPGTKIGVVCAPGNNGGDGLGIARLLSEWGYVVNVWIVRGVVKETADFQTNLLRLPQKVKVVDFLSGSPAVFADRDVLIDAVFGSGLSRSVEGIYAEVIEAMNASGKVIVAVDIPSGLFTDQHSEGVVVKAAFTISFQLPKLAFLLPENNKYVGSWQVVDIGLSKTFIDEAPSHYFYLQKKSVRKIIRPRSIFNHKGDFGRVLLIAGSYGKMGACILSARAALRAGVGLLTVHVPSLGYEVIQSAVPEAMASVDSNAHVLSEVPPLETFDVLGVGPGLGQAKETVMALQKILACGKPMVLDADALNILSAQRELLHTIPKGSILTPHPKEFERLVGTWKNDFERLAMQVDLARQLQCVVVLKGAHTSIATPEGDVYFNSTGNPGMATGGSGDVLTGILTGLLAQKYSATNTAILGVYLHGLAGDLAAREKGMNSLIASDLIDFLPNAFRDVGRAG